MGDNCGCNNVANTNCGCNNGCSNNGCDICNNSKFLFFILIFILLVIDN